MLVEREGFLRALEACESGLSERETTEQSSCFVFLGGRVHTYDDEVGCSFPSPLGDFEGAVKGGKLLETLRAMTEETVDVSPNGEALLVSRPSRSGKKSGSRRAGVRMEREVVAPLDAIEKPKKWKKLPEDFTEAVGVVGRCAGKSDDEFGLTCVHLHPEWVEACDNYQACRWKMALPVKGPSLLRQKSLRGVVSSGVTEFSETEGWIHFRGPSGLVISCRRYLEEYVDLEPLFHVEGEVVDVALPKSLPDALKMAQIFSSEDPDHNVVRVDLAPGRVRVKGQGVSGWWNEVKRLEYSGPPLSFLVSPILLTDLVEKHNHCLVTTDRLKADTGSYQYVTVLARPEYLDEAEAEASE